MKLYCGIDLHSNNHYLALIDEHGKPILDIRLNNELALTLKTLEPYRADIIAIAIESTYNWYWIVDGLAAAGYSVMLVNTNKARQYDGLKHSDDRHDAFWIAEQMRLGILPTGYIYPKAERGLRDLLRERRRLIQQRTTHLLSLQSTISRHTAQKLPSKVILGERKAPWPTIQDPNVTLGIEAHKAMIATLNTHIEGIERTVLEQVKPRPEYTGLLSARGIGPILALTIVLETGDIGRFPQVGNYASYARSVESKRTSNNKKKGKGNEKNGNPYLAWAYFEAAHFAIQFEPAAKRFYERKAAQRNKILAMKALAHKISRGCYYVMRDKVPFKPEMLFT